MFMRLVQQSAADSAALEAPSSGAVRGGSKERSFGRRVGVWRRECLAAACRARDAERFVLRRKDSSITRCVNRGDRAASSASAVEEHVEPVGHHVEPVELDARVR